MNRFLLLILLFSTCGALFAQNFSDSLDIELTNHYRFSKLPGFSVAIVNENGVLYQNGFGVADKESQKAFTTSTIQNLGSVSKTVVGLALVKAIEEGHLTMDTKINDILPFKVINPYYKDAPILVRHLANHTSTILDTKHYGKTYILNEGMEVGENVHQDFLSFITNHSKMELKDFLYKILNPAGDWYKKKNFTKAVPGTSEEYSNLNAALVAYLIEIATNTSFEEYTKAKIFEPLNMTRTGWEANDNDKDLLATLYFPTGAVVPPYTLITYPDGELYSNAEDLTKFLQEMIKAYGGASTYLPSKFAKLLLPGDNDTNRAFWGMGVESRNMGHRGSDPGVQADFQFNADSKVGRIIISNVNAEDNDDLWEQYGGIHKIVIKYEKRIK